MTGRRTLLLDTNVWLDYFLGWRDMSPTSRRLVDLALNQDCTLTYAVSSVKDVFYIVASEHKRLERASEGSLGKGTVAAANAAAWGCVNALQEMACAVPLDHTDVWMASKQRVLHADFEDDLIIAAALRARADYLVTNDEGLLRHCPVAALDARDMVALLEAEGVASSGETPRP